MVDVESAVLRRGWVTRCEAVSLAGLRRVVKLPSVGRPWCGMPWWLRCVCVWLLPCGAVAVCECRGG